MREKIIMTVIASMVCTSMFAASVNLAWDPPVTNTDGTVLVDLAGYKVCYGYSSGMYSVTNDVGNVTTNTLNNVTGLVYIAAIAYNAYGDESAHSTEFVWSAFAPNAPVLGIMTYSTKTGRATIPFTAPTKNNDGSSTSGQISGYLIGYSQISRGVSNYQYWTNCNASPVVLIVPKNSGTWYCSISATNKWGAIGASSAEVSFGTSTPSKPAKFTAPPLDLR